MPLVEFLDRVEFRAGTPVEIANAMAFDAGAGRGLALAGRGTLAYTIDGEPKIVEFGITRKDQEIFARATGVPEPTLKILQELEEGVSLARLLKISGSARNSAKISVVLEYQKPVDDVGWTYWLLTEDGAKGLEKRLLRPWRKTSVSRDVAA